MFELLSSIITIIMTSLFVLVLIVALTALGYVLANKLKFSRELASSASDKNRKILLIKIPKSNDQKEDAMEAFLLSMHRVLSKGSRINLEMATHDQFLRFYIVIDRQFQNVLESQLYAQFPDAELEEVDDYLPDDSKTTEVLEMNFKRSSTISIKTYKDLEEDLLKNLSALFSKTNQGEKVFVQISLKKIGSKPWDRGFMNFFKANRSDAQDKLSNELYSGKLRIAFESSSKNSSKLKVKEIASLYKVVKGKNEFKKNKNILGADLFPELKARMFDDGDLWSIPEIVTLFHFPYKGNNVSNVVDSTSKRSPAPDNLPFEGQTDSSEMSVFGETNYRNEHKKFGIKREDRRRHLYVVGKTGSGKSRLLQLLLVDDIQNNQGCCLIDPHGDLADTVLKFVPKDRVKDVVYINPVDRDFPVGFNPLEPVENYEERQHLSRFFISIFKKMFAENWNSRMEHLLRYITLALLETPDSNVIGITRMLSDVDFRQSIIKQIKDPVVKSFWTNEFSASNEQFINAAAVPIINKLGQFVSNPIIRNMVGQQKNMLDFDKFMNEGKIVIINLSKGKLGEENAALLGSMFITKIQQAALARAKIEEDQRKDFYFYVDEFQNFATDAFSSILSEARKYRLDLTIAHQYIAQLPDDVKATTFGNVGSIITFAIGADDAQYLSKEFSPTFSQDDMINLDVRDMYIKMSVNGKISTPFSASTITTSGSEIDYSHQIIDRTRVTYGRSRVTVENEIERWTKGEKVSSGSSSNEDFPEPII